MTQGRQIKALNRHFRIHKDTTFYSNVPTSAELYVESPLSPNDHVNAISKDTNGGVSAYRPTPPGNSPGVGHRKFGVENEDIKAKAGIQSPPDVKYSLAEGSKTDFRPTDPGHSPGAGHAAHQNKNNGEGGRVQNQSGLCPGVVGRNASTLPSRFLMDRKAIVVFVVSFAELGNFTLLCLKFLPSTKSSSWDKTNSTRKKRQTFQCIHGIRNLKSQGDQNLANHDQKNVHGGLVTPNETQSPPTPPSEPAPGREVHDFRPTAPGHSPGVGHSAHN
ncbi:precursor of CEP9-like [Neltuma alba]|uniref:precursor of CEP9-like n=1 Tax=Neltuma alba TaxID=207710 RepID=UPI0010A4E0EA|nr:precursor of CEP9-like [Prosopis alba]